MLNWSLLGFVLQIGLGTVAVESTGPQPADEAADSLRALRHGRGAQGAFERARRYALPTSNGSSGRCDVSLGQFCWWYDERPIRLPEEPPNLSRRRSALIATLDSLAERHPGDDWLTGMRVFYRVDGGYTASADSAARGCRGSTWWCHALLGYAKHLLGDAAAADSAFQRSLAAMAEADRCRWRSIAPLLPPRTRSRYERASCDARAPVEDRYWLLSRPRLAAAAHEWRNEFFVRRVQSRLAERAATPQAGGWGRDADELLLRYGWPVGWSRVDSPPGLNPEPSVVGHDPTPSFAFGPAEALLDSLSPAGDDAWDLENRLAESRFAPRRMARAATMAAQLARFRRGDSILLAAAFSASHDSLGVSSTVALGATLLDGRTVAATVGRGSSRRAVVRLPSPPQLAGVEIADTLTATLARARRLYGAGFASAGLSMSDLLFYRPAADPPSSLEVALPLAIAGDTASRNRPLGVFWETYGVPAGGEGFDVAVTVERVDRSWLRGARQRLRMASPDSPIKLRWNDARPATDGPASRAISLDLGNLPAGRYRVTVTLAGEGSARTSATRDLRLTER